MRVNGKIDYLEMPAPAGSIDRVKAFYVQAFDWSFTDYGPSYAAYSEGLDGGFDGTPENQATKPLPFPGGRRFHFTDPAGNELAVWSET